MTDAVAKAADDWTELSSYGPPYSDCIHAAFIAGADWGAKNLPADPAHQTHLRWLPIERADKSTDRIYDFPGMPRPIGNSEEYWCRDADGRVFLATWADDGKRAYWWDLEGESPVDPVEFMPHPLDPRFQEKQTDA